MADVPKHLDDIIEKIKKNEVLEESRHREVSDILAETSRLREENARLSDLLHEKELEKEALCINVAEKTEKMKFKDMEKKLMFEARLNWIKKTDELEEAVEKEAQARWDEKRNRVAEIREQIKQIKEEKVDPEEMARFQQLLEGTLGKPKPPAVIQIEEEFIDFEILEEIESLSETLNNNPQFDRIQIDTEHEISSTLPASNMNSSNQWTNNQTCQSYAPHYENQSQFLPTTIRPQYKSNFNSTAFHSVSQDAGKSSFTPRHPSIQPRDFNQDHTISPYVPDKNQVPQNTQVSTTKTQFNSSRNNFTTASSLYVSQSAKKSIFSLKPSPLQTIKQTQVKLNQDNFGSRCLPEPKKSTRKSNDLSFECPSYVSKSPFNSNHNDVPPASLNYSYQRPQSAQKLNSSSSECPSSVNTTSKPQFNSNQYDLVPAGSNYSYQRPQSAQKSNSECPSSVSKSPFNSNQYDMAPASSNYNYQRPQSAQKSNSECPSSVNAVSKPQFNSNQYDMAPASSNYSYQRPQSAQKSNSECPSSVNTVSKPQFNSNQYDLVPASSNYSYQRPQSAQKSNSECPSSVNAISKPQFNSNQYDMVPASSNYSYQRPQSAQKLNSSSSECPSSVNTVPKPQFNSNQYDLAPASSSYQRASSTQKSNSSSTMTTINSKQDNSEHGGENFTETHFVPINSTKSQFTAPKPKYQHKFTPKVAQGCTFKNTNPPSIISTNYEPMDVDIDKFSPRKSFQNYTQMEQSFSTFKKPFEVPKNNSTGAKLMSSNMTDYEEFDFEASTPVQSHGTSKFNFNSKYNENSLDCEVDNFQSQNDGTQFNHSVSSQFCPTNSPASFDDKKVGTCKKSKFVPKQSRFGQKF